MAVDGDSGNALVCGRGGGWGVTMQVSVQAGSGCLLCQVYPQAWALEAQFLVHIPGCIS